MPDPVVVTAPSANPVSLAGLAAHLRTSVADDAALLQGLLDEAVTHLQDISWTQFCTATYDVALPCFGDEMVLPRPPLQSVTSVKYYDTYGVQQTLASTVYEVITDRRPGRVRLKYGQSWPAIQGRNDPITVRYVCGYGAANDVPDPIRAAIKLYCEARFDQMGKFFGTSHIAQQLIEIAESMVPHVRRIA